MNGYAEVNIEIYEPVAANVVMPLAEGTSGTGNYYNGIRIHWTTEVDTPGITGKSWYTENPNSPFFDFDGQYITDYANEYNQLNNFFGEWVNSEKDQEAFISAIYGCWEFIENS